MARRIQDADDSIYPGLISKFEHGKAEPSLVVLLKYARLAGTSTDILIDDKQTLPKELLATRERR
ncbi:MAG: hypothetical protein ACR2H4_19710 [Pyrinomonadaceae bacterium]